MTILKKNDWGEIINHALLMYNVSEREILTEWSLETLVKKVRSGFNFELMKKRYSD
ncbi:hypothetical protein [Treponema phagedenis]|uniref:hypothetical protein n=1 Tax=Treponema phagedenis TaxID=162 RepID=UPI0015A5BFF3|nr:hypothetical protein [Treponema phagedenis]